MTIERRRYQREKSKIHRKEAGEPMPDFVFGFVLASSMGISMTNSQIKRIEFAPQSAAGCRRVAAYARVSSGKDAMLQSLEAQVSYYSELIQKHCNWEYIGVYADEAKTGTKDNRENFQALLTDCRAGKIDMVITKSISRFARNTVTLLEVVRELKGLDIDVFFEEQNIHSLSTDGELMLTILASYAQEESLSVSENQKWRVRKNFEEGKPCDCTILGYRVDNGVFKIVLKEAETVRLVFKMYLEGFGMTAIANRLNEMGVPTRKNKTWCKATIGKMLRNEAYAGDLLLQKTFRTDHISKRTVISRGELSQFFVSEAHEPIIDRNTFDAVQAEIERRAVAANVKQGSATAFTGKIRCGICGKNYRRKTTATGIVWICSTFNVRGRKFGASKQIPEETLKTVCAEALGIDAFDGRAFSNRVEFITAQTDNLLEFHFTNGRTGTARWQDRSRRKATGRT